MVARAGRPELVFLTGDLGFMALEPLQKALGDRFINAGVSEQNMVSVGAALAKDGWKPWCYSIAPFCFARPFEQIRNDVCLHVLPVKLVGNGGGFGYGVMGPTHHAVEDYGILLTLPEMRVFAPAFNEDVPHVVPRVADAPGPSYLRLGRGEAPKGEAVPAYAPWRQLLDGRGPVAVVVGPIGGAAWDALRSLDEKTRPKLWLACELPITCASLPAAFSEQLSGDGRLLVIEEHVRQGGAASQLAMELALAGRSPRRFRSLAIESLSSNGYGSQAFLRGRTGLDPASMRRAVEQLGQE